MIKQTLPELFRAQATQTKHNIAVVFKDKSLTYAELDRLTDNIAAELNRRGIGREAVVGLLLSRSEFLPVFALGVMKSGAAYLPLDATYPASRLEFMLQDSGATLLIHDEIVTPIHFEGDRFSTQLLSELPNRQPMTLPKPTDAMIILYTSGSTGTPKGVILEHRNIANYCVWYKNYTALTENDGVLAYASFGFDANMMDMYPALISGATLHILAEELRLDIAGIDDYITQNKITVAFITTQMARQFAITCDNYSLRFLVGGGEKLVPFVKKTPFKFVNIYGPTECAIAITAFTIDGHYDTIPVGKPVDNCEIYILNEKGERVIDGEQGEVCVAGLPVGRGYLNRPEQTEKIFAKSNPFNENPDYGVIYHTGDIGRRLPTGDLEIVGRKDAQVKIRGFRIELTEVEEVTRRFSGVKDATIADYEYENGGKYIVAYVTSEQTIDIEALKTFIATEKPAYMVPSVIMQIDRIPLTNNGKVDKRALPKPQMVFEDVTPPSTDLQKKIMDILVAIIGISGFGVNTDLTVAGLNSIGAVKLMAALSKEIGVSVKFSDLADHNSVVKLEKLIEHTTDTTHTKFDIQQDYPLTKTQTGIYLECLKNTHALSYNLPLLLSIDSAIDPVKLADAVKLAAANHPSINAYLTLKNGEPCQIRDDHRPIAIETFNISDEAWQATKATLTRSFDLFKPNLYRFEIYVTPSRVYLFVDIHHIICDGGSYAILIDDISRAYGGELLKPEGVTGFDLALTEATLIGGEHYQSAKSYYDTICDGADESPLPPQDVNEAVSRSAVYSRIETKLEPVAVENLASQLNITANVLFTGLFGYVMTMLTGREDYTFTTIYNGRNRAELDRTVGMFVKTVPVRIHTTGEKVITDYLTDVKGQLLNNMRYDIYPFSELSRSKGVSPDVMFAYQGAEFTDFKINGFETTEELMPITDAQAPIVVQVFLEQGRYKFNAEYRADMFSENMLTAIIDALVSAVNALAGTEKLGDLSLLSSKAVDLLAELNDTAAPHHFVPASEQFAIQAKAHPDRIAITAIDGKMTFGQLHHKVDQVAAALLPYARHNGIIAVLVDRTTDVFVARQAILRAGGAFLSIDAQYPADRVKYIIEDSNATTIICDETTRGMVEQVSHGLTCFTIAELTKLNTDTKDLANVKIQANDLAYCIYTSGSTGNPKGVMIEQHNLCNLVTHSPKNHLTSGMVGRCQSMLAIASVSFDASVLNEFIPLCNGLSVVLPSDDQIHNPVALRECMLENGVDLIDGAPAFLTNIMDMPEMRDCLEQVKSYVVGGEAFPAALYDKIIAINPKAHIMNGYGPTETTVCSSTDVVTSSKHITIGKPEANFRCYAVTSNQKILPPGFKGELCIVGEGVGRGYIGLPERTAAAFIDLNEPDGKRSKAYLTGDLVVIGFDKKIIYHGRKDSQVKLRGFRVELGEIESAINAYDGIKASTVIVKENEAGQYLAAYFTATQKMDSDDLKATISKHLAHYMVPNVYLQMDKLPLTSNGKVDKKRLPEIVCKRRVTAYVKPETSLERELCEKIASILGLKRVGATDNFFELGGTSLTASKLAMFAASKKYPFFYADIFKHPTARELAMLVDGEPADEDNDAVAFGSNFDYRAIDAVLAENKLENFTKDSPIGDILLTGATGFLGIHLLREFLENHTGKAYCLLRKPKKDTCLERRLESMMTYYFDVPYKEAIANRVVIIEGDMTNEEEVTALEKYDFDTVINCAANVKHFATDDSIMRVNYGAVLNLIKLCHNTARRLVHVSTYSVAGETNVCPIHAMTERELYFGQIIENEYIKSKFMAEYAILSAVANGLQAKIMRVGNLSARSSDGEFQINFNTNGFMRKLRGFKAVQAFPYGMMNETCEFSPIDDTAKAILLLAETGDKLTVFMPFNNHVIYMSDVIAAMNRHGYAIESENDDAFTRRLADFGKTENAEKATGIIAYNTANARVELPADNTLTSDVLYRLKFKWPITDDLYLENAINALATLGFFK